MSEEYRELAEYLQCSHVGEANAVKARELTNHSWGSAREIRALVHTARLNGYAICSSDRGYFYASSAAEVLSCVNRLRATGRELCQVIYQLERSTI